MSKIKGIYAATMSVLNDDLTLNIKKTIQHAELVIENGCHGAAVFGSTGQAQLIPVSEKINLLNHLTLSKHKEKYIIGTGLNSLGETINLMRVSKSLDFNRFLIMPPAYYKYGDKEVIEFYGKIVESISDCEIVLYNFEKLCGYKFSTDCIEELVRKYPKNIIGVKDSSYNLFENLKINNFSILPGSESKLFKGLQLGCSGIITATCNATSKLSRKVYDDFNNNSEQTVNENLCDVRAEFEKYNLISGLHAFFGQNDKCYRNILPPLSNLNSKDEKDLIANLENLNFSLNNSMAA
jgi:4-hydroxy-tetrahydrodipicolinate synthase